MDFIIIANFRMSVLIETSLGNVVIDLWTDDCPRTCLNFLKLCKVKFFNFHQFHSVQAGFAAQTGDPDGSGNQFYFYMGPRISYMGEFLYGKFI